MPIPSRNTLTHTLMVSDGRVVGQNLTDSACELAILVIDEVVVGTCAAYSAAFRDVDRRQRFKISPSICLAVDTGRVGQIMRSSRVSSTVTPEDRHARAECWLRRRVGVEEILESDVVDESLGIKGLLSVDLIECHYWSLKYISIAVGCDC